MMKGVIVITGADNGIGFHMARALLEDGYRVAALDICGENLSSLKANYPERLLVFNCDVTDLTRLKQTVSSIVETWGAVDVLVNNACIAIFKPFEQKSLDDTHREFEVNYFGFVNTITAVLPYMEAERKGIIHNMSSGVGITGFPGIYGYASTKGAIESLTRTLALELEKYGISVNLMHPPLTNTKSAAPLGIPAQAMDDPARVGLHLARQIMSTRAVIASDYRTRIYLFFAYRYPKMLGRIFARLAAGANSN